MFNPLRALCALLTMMAAAACVQAETGILIVKVLDLQNKPLRGLRVNLEEPGCVALGPADDKGFLRIKLAPGIKPQTWVTLELASARYAFIQPWDRRAQVPPFEDEFANYVRVFLIGKGDRAALESGKFAVQMAAQFNAKLTPQPQAAGFTEAQRKAVLAEVARGVGLQPEAVDQAIREYGKRAVDPYEKGEIALYERNYPEAVAQLSQSYELRKKVWEKAQAEMAEVAFALGQAHYQQGQYHEAAAKFQVAQEIRKDDAVTLNWLGTSLHQAGQYAAAEPLLRLNLEINEKTLGKDQVTTATSLNNLAELYKSQGNYAEAEQLYKRALEIKEKSPIKDHPTTARSLNNLAALYYEQGKYAEAEPLYKRALEIFEKSSGEENPNLAISLNNLAKLYYSQGKYAEAEPLYKRALTIIEKALGAEPPKVAKVLENYALLLRTMKRDEEAARLEARARAIREKAKAKPPN